MEPGFFVFIKFYYYLTVPKNIRHTVMKILTRTVSMIGFSAAIFLSSITELNSRENTVFDSLESRIRVLCTLTYFCYIAGDPCPGVNWPITANFGELGIHEVTCYEGAVVEG
jgi:hypothetical protein